MSKLNSEEIVDVEALEFADDIEEIVISDYSGEEEDPDVEIIENNSQCNAVSELKISSVVSCIGLQYEETCTDNSKELIEQESDLNISSVVGEEGSSDCNLSYDSLTEDEDIQPSKKAELERKRRNNLRTLYCELWKAISSEPLAPTYSQIKVLTTSLDLIKKLTVEGRKLEYSGELCLQSNYRLKRRLKKISKKRRKRSVDNRELPKPGKVVTCRASI